MLLAGISCAFFSFRRTDNDDVVTSYFSTRGKKLGILSLFSYAKESILPERVKKAY